MTEEHLITIEKTARVRVMNPSGKPVANVLALHGYGQLVEFFIRKFSGLSEENYKVIAPEGFHRFYQSGHSGRVGASWMTREARLQDIADYEKYLDQVVGTFCDPNVPLIVFGFSQGVATACRWVSQTQYPVKGLITWAGTFPSDIDWNVNAEKLNHIAFHAFFGDNDEFIPLDKAKDLILELESAGVVVHSNTYQGLHEFTTNQLLNAFNQLGF